VVRVRLLTFAAVFAVPAFAQNIYSWEDAEGVHYTDDASKIPKKVKAEARVADAAPVSKGMSTPAPTVAVVPASASASTEFEWRDAFIAAHRRIVTVRKSLAALEASLPPRVDCVVQPAGLVVVDAQATGTPQQPLQQGRPPRCQVNRVHDQLRVQIAQEEVQLKNAELDLEQLDRRASMQSVPREWRRGW
jgi:hypothetical protein